MVFVWKVTYYMMLIQCTFRCIEVERYKHTSIHYMLIYISCWVSFETKIVCPFLMKWRKSTRLRWLKQLSKHLFYLKSSCFLFFVIYFLFDFYIYYPHMFFSNSRHGIGKNDVNSFREGPEFFRYGIPSLSSHYDHILFVCNKNIKCL